jgi:hypothetical protein
MFSARYRLIEGIKRFLASRESVIGKVSSSRLQPAAILFAVLGFRPSLRFRRSIGTQPQPRGILCGGKDVSEIYRRQGEMATDRVDVPVAQLEDGPVHAVTK